MSSSVVWVYDADGKRLADTSPRNAKLWLKSGRAKFVCKNPFSIRLVDVKSFVEKEKTDSVSK